MADYRHSPEYREKMRLCKLGEKNPCYGKHVNVGENNGMWKGDKVKYFGLHDWVKRHIPKPNFCKNCNQQKQVELCNISGKYLRDLTDWEYLCRRCHMIKDGRMKNLYYNHGVH